MNKRCSEYIHINKNENMDIHIEKKKILKILSYDINLSDLYLFKKSVYNTR
jgi:hypothetical protein